VGRFIARPRQTPVITGALIARFNLPGSGQRAISGQMCFCGQFLCRYGILESAMISQILSNSTIWLVVLDIRFVIEHLISIWFLPSWESEPGTVLFIKVIRPRFAKPETVVLISDHFARSHFISTVNSYEINSWW
jgi:hypothetical protein